MFAKWDRVNEPTLVDHVFEKIFNQLVADVSSNGTEIVQILKTFRVWVFWKSRWVSGKKSERFKTGKR